MRAFNFARLIYIFVTIALFSSFQSTDNGVSSSIFEQSFVRLKLRKPKLGKKEKKQLIRQRNILQKKLADSQISGSDERSRFIRKQIEKIDGALE